MEGKTPIPVDDWLNHIDPCGGDGYRVTVNQHAHIFTVDVGYYEAGILSNFFDRQGEAATECLWRRRAEEEGQTSRVLQDECLGQAQLLQTVLAPAAVYLYAGGDPHALLVALNRLMGFAKPAYRAGWFAYRAGVSEDGHSFFWLIDPESPGKAFYWEQDVACYATSIPEMHEELRRAGNP